MAKVQASAIRILRRLTAAYKRIHQYTQYKIYVYKYKIIGSAFQMVMEVEVELHNVQIIFAQTKRLCDKKEEVCCVCECTSLTVYAIYFTWPEFLGL